MRATWLFLLLSAGLCAQPKEVTFQEVTNAVVAGYAEDAKAEKAWEMRSASMKPTAEAGTWDLDKLEGKSFKGGKVVLSFSSPYGTLIPAKRVARGPATFSARSPSFDLKGMGWSWLSEPQGDRFTIEADVVAELDLAKPVTRRLRIRAERLEVSPRAEGTLLVFVGKVVLERLGEKLTCRRIECLLDDGPKGDKTCRSLQASGEVVRTLNGQTLRGDVAFFDQANERLTVTGAVRLSEPGLQAEGQQLEHDAKTNVTRLVAADGQRVHLKSTRLGREASEAYGKTALITRDLRADTRVLQLDGAAEFTSEEGKVTAQRLVATDSGLQGDVLVGEGDVQGSADGNLFKAGKARWDRTRQQLRLDGRPRLIEPRGFEVAGATILSDTQKQQLTVSSAPDERASVKLPPADVDGPIGLAQADRIFVGNEAGAVEVDLVGNVLYAAGDVHTESQRMVAYASAPLVKGRPSVLVLQKVFLTGAVRYGQPGLRCSAERIDYVPAVQIEEILKTDNLTGRPRLLTLSGGSLETRPRLGVDFSNGKSAEFIADAQEILATPQMTKFFLRGAVGMRTEGTDATCDLLEGLAEPDAKGKQAARLIVGRGNVNVLAGGTTAYGRTLEVRPEVGEAKLFGDARIRDPLGREGIPAKEITYDMKKRVWRMDQAPDPNLPGQVVRPKIFLGPDFTLPQVKSLDKGR
jgi:lipopolysaccharide export system protein LptA